MGFEYWIANKYMDNTKPSAKAAHSLRDYYHGQCLNQ